MRTGAIEQVTDGLSLDPEGVSPAANGRQAIATLPGEEGEVVALDLETGEVETLAVFVGARVDGCHRSASGQYIVTVVSREEEATITAVHTEGMRTVPIHGSPGGATAARFSPDSKNSVLYISTATAALRSVEFDGEEDRELCSDAQAFGAPCTGPGARPNTELPNVCRPSWLGAGEEVLFIAGAVAGPVMAVPRQGGRPRTISRLAYQWARSNGAGDQIVGLASDTILLIKPQTGEVHSLCSRRGAEARPCFTPDGRSVVFSERDRHGYVRIFHASLSED